MKDLEISYDKPIINLHAVIMISLILICAFFYIAPLFKHKEVDKPVIKNESKVIEKVYVTIMIPPTPDGKLYFASEFEEGIRKIQNPFSFFADNASGYKRMLIRSFVYDYKRLPYMTWHNDIDQLDYRMHPHENCDFLVVYYAMYIDDRVADNVRYYIPSINNYVVTSINGDKPIYIPMDVPKQLKFIDLEYSYDFNNVEIAQYFGQHTEYSRRGKDRQTGGYTSVEDDVLRAGKSNAESGYIIYQIPKDLETKDIIAGINFASFGTSYWKLQV